MKIHFAIMAALTCLGLSTSFSLAAEKLKGKLVLTGSSTIAPLAVEIGRRFEKMHPEVRIDVQTGGSSRGVNDLRKNLSQIGLVSRALHAEEADLQASSIARDGVAVILHRDNPVKTLSRDEIVAIYTGKIKNWKDVGGKSAPITVVNKAEGRSTLELFVQFLGLKNSEIKASVIIGDNEQGIKTVAGNPESIGYVSIGTAEYSASEKVAIKLLTMNGIAPSTSNLQNGSYPLQRPLNLVVRKGAIPALEAAFIQYAQSSSVEDLVKEQYFVPDNTKRSLAL